MGAIGTVTLNGATLAPPSTYKADVEYLGGVVVLADGSLRRDLVRSTARCKFSLAWVALTTDEKNALLAAWGAAVTTQVSFVAPDGTSTTVTAPEDARLSFESYQSQGSLLWKSAIELWEV